MPAKVGYKKGKSSARMPKGMMNPKKKKKK